MEEPEKNMAVEHQLEQKKERIDESIERGRQSANRLKKINNYHVAEANIAMATIRGLLSLLEDKEENK